jgi:hypothetical protein
MLSVGTIAGSKKEILLEENERILGIKSISRAPKVILVRMVICSL